jgi:hypothetical protein
MQTARMGGPLQIPGLVRPGRVRRSCGRSRLMGDVGAACAASVGPARARPDPDPDPATLIAVRRGPARALPAWAAAHTSPPRAACLTRHAGTIEPGVSNYAAPTCVPRHVQAPWPVVTGYARPPDMQDLPREPRRHDRGSFCTWGMRTLPRSIPARTSGRFCRRPGHATPPAPTAEPPATARPRCRLPLAGPARRQLHHQPRPARAWGRRQTAAVPRDDPGGDGQPAPPQPAAGVRPPRQL